jgi:hypothetical protein
MKITDLVLEVYYTVRFALEDALHGIKSKFAKNYDYADDFAYNADDVEEEQVKPKKAKKKSKKKKKA